MLELYQNIKRLRNELGMTQTELAHLVGYADKSMIARVEAGQVDLGQSKIEAFAAALNTTPAKLIGWDAEEQNRDAVLQEAFDRRPEMRMLFSVAESASAEDIQKAIRIIEALKGAPEKD